MRKLKNAMWSASAVVVFISGLITVASMLLLVALLVTVEETIEVFAPDK